MIVAEGEEKGCGPIKGNWFLKMDDEEEYSFKLVRKTHWKPWRSEAGCTNFECSTWDPV